MKEQGQDKYTGAAGLSELAAVAEPIGAAGRPDLKRKRVGTSFESLDVEKESLLVNGRLEQEDGPDSFPEDEQKPRTYLYLAYGSNLARKTFEGRRRVKPLSAVNVHVPTLELTFDLPGFAYVEPCFANTRWRKAGEEKEEDMSNSPCYNTATNLGWNKGLVGVVYEVTAADYKHIIETEGGGASYEDVEVQCYPLHRDNKLVPDPDSYSLSDGHPFFAHTLLAPAPSGSSHQVRRPGWAQPSPRYLGLLRAGSVEHALPLEYLNWLESLQPYVITTTRQRIGSLAFMALWAPLIFPLIKMGQIVADNNVRAPTWFGALMNFTFSQVWRSYDTIFYRIAGEGERTVGT